MLKGILNLSPGKILAKKYLGTSLLNKIVRDIKKMKNNNKIGNNIATPVCLVDSERPLPDKYKKIIQEQTYNSERRASGMSGVWRALMHNPNEGLKNLFNQYLKGKVLIDLGSGVNGQDMLKLSKLAGVKTLIGVDIAFDFVDKSGSSIVAKEYFTEDNIRRVRIKSDMLEFVSRIDFSDFKQGDVGIAINNIDSIIINDSRYITAIADEIEKITYGGGVVLGVNSSNIAEELRKRGLRDKVVEGAIRQVFFLVNA